ncbi:hypothetical protein GDO78_005437 [Eleutherodactylus coqui]|uniref:Uncharacterized protein n=1 Tax=Eleutherodactylus coqui TaxID=57060 RepID=A0A8J6FLE0_ELECQ|nr:hypothetical protein GDO78_005437 [Eleutherodactylus coqui]
MVYSKPNVDLDYNYSQHCLYIGFSMYFWYAHKYSTMQTACIGKQIYKTVGRIQMQHVTPQPRETFGQHQVGMNCQAVRHCFPPFFNKMYSERVGCLLCKHVVHIHIHFFKKLSLC